jgi:hypothetical protein
LLLKLQLSLGLLGIKGTVRRDNNGLNAVLLAWPIFTSLRLGDLPISYFHSVFFLIDIQSSNLKFTLFPTPLGKNLHAISPTFLSYWLPQFEFMEITHQRAAVSVICQLKRSQANK